jgi:hypothetical protein
MYEILSKRWFKYIPSVLLFDLCLTCWLIFIFSWYYNGYWGKILNVNNPLCSRVLCVGYSVAMCVMCVLFCCWILHCFIRNCMNLFFAHFSYNRYNCVLLIENEPSYNIITLRYEPWWYKHYFTNIKVVQTYGISDSSFTV